MSSAGETTWRGPETTQRGRGTQLSPAPRCPYSASRMWDDVLGPSDQPSCQLKTTEWRQSKPCEAEVLPSWALPEFITHKSWDIIKQVYLQTTKIGVICYIVIDKQNSPACCHSRNTNIGKPQHHLKASSSDPYRGHSDWFPKSISPQLMGLFKPQ